MNKAGEIISISPKCAIPNGEIVIDCADFQIDEAGDRAVYFDDIAGRILAASSRRLIVSVPEGLTSTDVSVRLESGGDRSAPVSMTVGTKLVDEMHIVANPAVDPKDDALIVTRSGSRGQQLPVTLFRLDSDGFISDMAADVLNPTSVAFDAKGDMFVTNRADGEVCRVVRDEEIVTFSTGLGTATGLAFDQAGTMYVGDRAGTIYRVSDFGNPEVFATLESSVAAYHMAFGIDGRLYVTAPGLSSFDAVYAVESSGFETKYFRGLGRPQGLAFDEHGDLYVAACLGGRRGIVKITEAGESAEVFVAGNNVVGLCFTRKGEMLVATNLAVYRLPVGIRGTLLKAEK
ncbi:MAG: gluconolaconase [Acidobacteria bacterium]|nr:gluconolaconase [Acidobacteriota bacterium]